MIENIWTSYEYSNDILYRDLNNVDIYTIGDSGTYVEFLHGGGLQ